MSSLWENENQINMALRGDKLREHILWIAKEVFLEMGFERASMDEVARRAATSKRTLYAYFESKDKLFLAIIEFVRQMLAIKLGQPGDYSKKPAEALTLFCGRCLEIALYKASIQMMRISMAEAERCAEQAEAYYNSVFSFAQSSIAVYLRERFRLSARASEEAAQRLFAVVMFPRLHRTLFRIDPPLPMFDPHVRTPRIDLRPIRKAVNDLLSSFPVA